MIHVGLFWQSRDSKEQHEPQANLRFFFNDKSSGQSAWLLWFATRMNKQFSQWNHMKPCFYSVPFLFVALLALPYRPGLSSTSAARNRCGCSGTQQTPANCEIFWVGKMCVSWKDDGLRYLSTFEASFSRGLGGKWSTKNTPKNTRQFIQVITWIPTR